MIITTAGGQSTDEHGNQTVVTYLCLDGKPMPIADGYATIKSTYDARGNVIRLATRESMPNRSHTRMVPTAGRQILRRARQPDHEDLSRFER